jgi:hypothetical protein
VTVRALVLNPDDDTAHLVELDGKLKSFQQLVGGYIEAIPLGGYGSAYINEEGKFAPLARNENAMALLEAVGQQLHPGDWIAGPLVAVGNPDREGNDTGVTNTVLSVVEGLGIPID